MDMYGIGQAVLGAALIYFRSARRTGRTIQLLNSLHDGDLLVFNNTNEARRVQCMAQARGITIRFHVLRTDRIDHQTYEDVQVRAWGTYGRVILDHSVIEALYIDAIKGCQDYVTRLESISVGAAPRPEINTQECLKWTL